MQRPDTFTTWSNARTAPAARLAAFETWALQQLRERLVWPADPAAAARQAGQCRAFVMEAVADMGEHGFLFQPRELARLIVDKIDAVARQQRAGQVREIYPYFRTAWRTWVRGETETLRDKAHSVGAHVQDLTARLLRSPLPDGRAMPPRSVCDLAAELRRERKAQRAAARSTVAGGQLPVTQPDLFSVSSSASVPSVSSPSLRS